MACLICDRSSCTESFHSSEEQERFAPAIELFEKARELRAQIRNEIEEEQQEEEPPVEEDEGLDFVC